MKKEEAILLAPHRSKLVIEYIEKILSSNEKVHGEIEFSSYKIDNQKMCTLNIIMENGFEKHINLGITEDHVDILHAQLFKDLLEIFLEHETIGVSRYYSVRNEIKPNFYGIDALNAAGGKISINFLSQGQNFDEIVYDYNLKINEYIEKINSGRKISSR